MTRTLRSEWTKLRTQRGTIVALLAMAVLMAGMSAFAASESETQPVFAGDDDVVQIALSGVVFAELAAVVVGASLITAEYTTGMIRSTLTATQGRLRVLLAKALALVLATFPVALAASGVGFVLASSLLHDRGYVAPAYPTVSLTDPEAMRAVAGTALLLTGYALIALGIGTVLRHTGATIAVAIAVVFVPLIMLGAFPEHVQTRLQQVTPLAGMSIQSTTGRMLSSFDDGSGMPIPPWAGLGVAFAWAVGLLALGFLLLRARDT